jgi:hypothetical protein
MGLSDTQWEFLQDVAELIVYAELKGYKLTGGELKRTVEQQKLYVKSGRSKTMNSDHLKSLAIDFNIFYDYDNDGDKDYTGSLDNAVDICEDLGDYWKYLHPDNYWGGDWENFPDTPHFGRKA